jgi:GH15 family glucan-1,4-alpha-glucosidase
VSDAIRRQDGFLPLELYGALGDGRSVALVGADGSIDWWCPASIDGAPMFDRILDPHDGGRFAVTPVAPFSVERRYREDSNVFELVFTTATGRIRVTDSLNSGISGRLPWSELARRVDGLEGTVECNVEVRAARALCVRSRREASPHGEVLHLDGLITAFRASGPVERTGQTGRGVTARLQCRAGERSTLALLAGWDVPLILSPLTQIDARIDRSDQAWREWTGNLKRVGRYDAAVRRSALALKLLVHSPSGAIAAAATTSLPEGIGGAKNYDYRYAWLRDVTYTIKAFLRVGATAEAQAAFSWLTRTVGRHGGRLATMYTLDGQDVPRESVLDLPGYRGSRPVRRGNKAARQLQLGMFGDVFETASLFVAEGHVLDLATRKLLADAADQCVRAWRRKDSGMWELERREHYTLSKIGCWLALDRAVSLVDIGQLEARRAGLWRRTRDRIRDWIETRCWSEAKQAYVLYAGSDQLDAGLLLAVRFGFPNSARLSATRDAVQRELMSGPHVYRYSGMQAEEGAFIACGFWLVEAFALLGEPAKAEAQMEAMLAACGGNLGLLHEQIDPATGAALGNVPQALSHLALIHAACAVAAAQPGRPPVRRGLLDDMMAEAQT